MLGLCSLSLMLLTREYRLDCSSYSLSSYQNASDIYFFYFSVFIRTILFPHNVTKQQNILRILVWNAVGIGLNRIWFYSDKYMEN